MESTTRRRNWIGLWIATGLSCLIFVGCAKSEMSEDDSSASSNFDRPSSDLDPDPDVSTSTASDPPEVELPPIGVDPGVAESGTSAPGLPLANTPPRVTQKLNTFSAGPSSVVEGPRSLSPANDFPPAMAESVAESSDSVPFIHRSTDAAAAIDLPDGVPEIAALESLPAGASMNAEDGFATVQVFYGTDRARDAVPLTSYSVSGAMPVVLTLVVCAGLCFCIAVFSLFRQRNMLGAVSGIGAIGCSLILAKMMSSGAAGIEKYGVTYTGERGAFVQGIAEVTVPASHERGQIESPSLLRLEFHEDQQKHIVLTRCVELMPADFYGRLQENVADSDQKELLVFVHGYNVDFESAVRRTAQLAVDLPFRGTPVCYSWPSQGSLLKYTIDESNVAWSAAHLREFLLSLVEQSGAQSINLVAHSMGNRALTSAVSEISLMTPDEADNPFDRVVLAAPDVDAGLFSKDLAPRMLRVANNVTLYASSTDTALIASKQVHGYPRAGDSGDSLVVVPGMDTIDVTGIDLSLLGHSYYGDSRVILSDLFELMHHRLPAASRRFLRPQQLNSQVYWRLLSTGVAVESTPLLQ